MAQVNHSKLQNYTNIKMFNGDCKFLRSTHPQLATTISIQSCVCPDTAVPHPAPPVFAWIFALYTSVHKHTHTNNTTHAPVCWITQDPSLIEFTTQQPSAVLLSSMMCCGDV